MSAQDSPGFPDHIPGLPPQNSHDYGTAPGSDGSAYGREAAPAREVIGRPVVTVPHASSQVPSDMPTVSVTAGDSQVPGQVPEYEPFTHVGNTYLETFPGGPASSHVSTPNHPNSNGVNRD